MTLGELVRDLPGVHLDGAPGIALRAIAADSREAGPGTLFVALPGNRADGRAFVADALSRGAVAVGGPAETRSSLPPGVPYVALDAPRRGLALLCRRFHGAPDEKLLLVGITGTNGKTTTAHLVAAALEAAGWRTAVGGTIGLRAGAFSAAGTLTTPEAPALWSFLARAVREGCGAAAIEVSSAALVADRAHGMRFAAGILTGMGHDHLDTHGTFENYLEAKTRLFRALPSSAAAVLPADDPHAAAFRAVTGARVVTFGESPSGVAGAADWSVSAHEPLQGGAAFRLAGPGFDARVRTARPGPWDARNLAAAVACATALGAAPDAAVRGAAALPGVDGRWERVDAGQPFAAIVDYAHTPEALDRTLALLRRVTEGRVLVVFGCGGERDEQKRPEMGRIAGRLADVVFVTEDNPRGEDPDRIAAGVLAGLAGTGARVLRVSGRAEAIRAAAREARPGDALLVTGKGHETYQEIRGARLPFDDREELRAALRAAR